MVCNDPYKGCTHTMDIVLFSPVFVDGELVAVTSTIAHHVDIGGKIPGTEAADNQEIFAEGLILPPLRRVDGGKPVQAIFDIVAANVRDPTRQSRRSACADRGLPHRRAPHRGALEAHTAPMRAAALTAACLDYAEIYMRRVIAGMPDGPTKPPC